MTKPPRTKEEWELENLVSERVRAALVEYDKEMKEWIATQFLIRLQKFDNAYTVGKFVVSAVALLVIGTLYQLFVTLANMAGGGQ